ncbi:hypothetical protein [Lentzea xinjiangensis]|uniref:hypothetical protein n=1 Tax=Lentzea xinjiangensis TaxID=402600 RepID=UPI000B7D23B2|nr:hypothetical protein [Lentzea xinjiangensis]
MKLRARRILAGALTFGASLVLLSTVAMPASALASPAGVQVPTVHARQIDEHKVVFQCGSVHEGEQSEVQGTRCRPPFYGLLTEPFIIVSDIAGDPYYECREGFADSPQYVAGRNCTKSQS